MGGLLEGDHAARAVVIANGKLALGMSEDFVREVRCTVLDGAGLLAFGKDDGLRGSSPR